MIYENIERGFLWRDYENVAALDNDTVKGFVAMLNGAFNTDTPSYLSLNSRLENVSIWSAIKNGSLDEPTMDLLAAQMNFTAWEYVGKYNLIAPFDTVLKRKQEMMRHLVRLMRYRGTPYAIEQALLAFGFTDVIILENRKVSVSYDGTFDYDGTVTYYETLAHQLFSVELTTILGIAGDPADDEQLDAIVSIINSFKKYRPELYQVIAHPPSSPGSVIRTIWSF